MVSVIIVNYNTFTITCNCIASVIQHTRDVPYEIIVVDNASPNDNPDLFLERFPDIVLIKSPENGGFARGNNLGIAKAKGNLLLLLNSDTWLTEDSISIAARYFGTLQQPGALTVRLVYPDGRLQHTARKFRSIRNELLDLARPLLRLLPYGKRSALLLNQYFNGNYNTEADWVSGAFMMFPRAILAQLPGNKLDERYFMYGEDQLWCYQFKKLGYQNYYLSTTTVVHIHSASTAPEHQWKLFRRMLQLELDFTRYRGKSLLYRLIFRAIFGGKEYARAYIKILAQRLLGKTL
ncbi:MAG: glycosyltransferase family 2 protein [Chitinophagia bacterium]|nr:glycosyltransferase family 2 protein [Chitinophagia bacterium]